MLGELLTADVDEQIERVYYPEVEALLRAIELLGTEVAFAAAYQLARPHPGQIAVAAELRRLLRESGVQAGHHGSAHKVQDPYSVRCAPRSRS